MQGFQFFGGHDFRAHALQELDGGLFVVVLAKRPNALPALFIHNPPSVPRLDAFAGAIIKHKREIIGRWRVFLQAQQGTCIIAERPPPNQALLAVQGLHVLFPGAFCILVQSIAVVKAHSLVGVALF